MSNDGTIKVELEAIDSEVVGQLTKRIRDIDNSYRSVAEKMGQLYMFADEHRVASLTRTLDKPMRNASENEQTFAAILEELGRHANRTK